MTSAFRLLRAPLLVLAIAAAFAAPSAAADIFTVRGIHVDETADSASAARTAAQAEGQRLALAAMMKKLTLPEDWSNLPSVDSATAQNAVRGFQVESEKTSSTRYIADLIVSFQPEAVRRLLRQAGVPFGETQARPAILLPVLHRDGNTLLWDDRNEWRDAWAAIDPADALTPLILPIGDIAEMNLVTAERATADDEAAHAALAELAANYGASEAIVADATLSAEGDSLSVVLTRRGAAEPLSATYEKTDEDLPGLMRAAAAGMLGSLGDQWKRQIIVRDGRLSTLTAQADFDNLPDWEKIRSALTSTPLVQAMEVSGISSRGAEIRISHKGTADMLALSLAQQNVTLSNGEPVAPAQGEPIAAGVEGAPVTAAASRWHLSAAQ